MRTGINDDKTDLRKMHWEERALKGCGIGGVGNRETFSGVKWLHIGVVTERDAYASPYEF